MELDWTPQSPHIRSLLHPWKPSDGCEEAEIVAAEERLGVRLPTTLRNFYLAWGKREDVTQGGDPLLFPQGLQIRANALFFWVENQGVGLWGIRCEDLGQADPPVVVTWNEEPLEWTASHAHVSNFLDIMTYYRAFGHGAIHGGWTHLDSPSLPDHHIAWLEEYWSKATVSSPWVFGFDADPLPPLYVREGQAFWTYGGSRLAARDAETLDEIGQRFQIKWTTRR